MRESIRAFSRFGPETDPSRFDTAQWRIVLGRLDTLWAAAARSRTGSFLTAAALARSGFRDAEDRARRPVESYVLPEHPRSPDPFYNARLDRQSDVANMWQRGLDGLFDIREDCRRLGVSVDTSDRLCAGVSGAAEPAGYLLDPNIEVLSPSRLRQRLGFAPLLIPAAAIPRLVPHAIIFPETRTGDGGVYVVYYAPPGWDPRTGDRRALEGRGLTLNVIYQRPSAPPADGTGRIENVSTNIQQRVRIRPVNRAGTRAFLDCSGNANIQWKVRSGGRTFTLWLNGKMSVERLRRLAVQVVESVKN